MLVPIAIKTKKGHNGLVLAIERKVVVDFSQLLQKNDYGRKPDIYDVHTVTQTVRLKPELDLGGHCPCLSIFNSNAPSCYTIALPHAQQQKPSSSHNAQANAWSQDNEQPSTSPNHPNPSANLQCEPKQPKH